MQRTLRHCLFTVVLLAGAACGQEAATPEDAGEATTPADGGASAAPAASAATADGPTVAVVAEDYRYTGVPESVAPGTTLTLTNASTAELHELVILDLGDETRPLDELLALPEDEQVGEFVGVLVAPPGEEGFAPGPPAVLAEPGRYALVCFIPQGADPEAYLAAVAASQGGPPEDVPGGPPHFTLGMAAEITVE